jgi:hypothetical protein
MKVMVVVEWTPHVSCIFTIYMYKYAMQKYFYETIKYEKMNDGFLYFSASKVNISYRVFMLRKSYLHGA